MRATERGIFPAHSTETDRPEAAAPPDRWARARLLPVHAETATRALQTRLAAILAADVADFSRHMAEDEAGTHARFMAVWRGVVEPVVVQHEGRTVKNTGDGFLATFASATSAVRCAVTFQRAVRHRNGPRSRALQFRVGINLGDVIFEPHDVFGHCVNVAARLEALAEPGGVLVSDAVRASVRDPVLCFEDAGELSLKNLDETVHGFRAQARGSRSTRRRPTRAIAA